MGSSVLDPGGSGDYTSIDAWVSAKAGTFSAIEDAEMRCTNGSAFAAGTIDGATTTTAYHWRLWVDRSSSYYHGGTYPASGNKSRIEGTNTTCLVIQDDHVKVDGLAIQATVTTDGMGISVSEIASDNYTYISNTIIKGVCSGSGSARGIYVSDLQSVGYVWNTIIYGFVSGTDVGFRGVNRNSSDNWFFLNITILYCYYTFVWNNADSEIWNGALDGVASPTFDGAVDYWAGELISGGGIHHYALTPANDYEVEFTDAANGDFSLVSGSHCIDNGMFDPNGWSLYDDDIAGNDRLYAGAGWDIGAFEYPAIGRTNCGLPLFFRP